MAKVKYVPNPLFEEEVETTPQFKRGMWDITDDGAAAVRRAAPVRTGYYRHHVKAIGTRIRTLDVFWHLVEFGSVNNPPYAPLRRGLRAAGFRLVVDPR